MKTNVARRNTRRTHEGAPASAINSTQALRRSVSSCLLWEREFYEDGVSIANRIWDLAHQVDPSYLATLAEEARSVMNLRHAPLWLVAALLDHPKVKDSTYAHPAHFSVQNTIANVVQRADEMGELLALYMKDVPQGQKRPLSAQLKKGLARAFVNFDAYQLAKYNRAGRYPLKTILKLVHPDPRDHENAEELSALWKSVVDGTIQAPDTWEVGLSAARSDEEKLAVWTRLLGEGRLGYLALLRNLRNMRAVGVPKEVVAEAILARKGARRVLPFRYVAAARAVPSLEPAIDQALSEAVSEQAPLSGQTIVLVDVSASMNYPLSDRSDLTRMDAGAALASVIHGDLRVFTFSHDVVEVAPRRGMAGVDAVINSQPHGGTYLGEAVRQMNTLPHSRLIVISDEQTADRVPDPAARHAYMINVASAKNGVGYGRWTHVDGFSESVLRFIREHEQTSDF